MLKKLKNNKNYGYVIMILLCLAISIPSFAQYQVMALGDRLRTVLGLSMSQFSSVATAPLIAGILVGFISGMLADRFGMKVLTASIIITTVGVCLRIVANGYIVLYLSMIMLGFSATFINTAAPKIMGSWFSAARTTGFMGILIASANVAMALGTGTAALFKSTGSVFIFTGVIAVAVLLLWMLLFKEKGSRDVTGKESTSGGVPFLESLTVVIKHKGVWAAAICSMSMAIGLTGCGVFMPQALMSRGMSEAGAGAMGMALTLGYMTTSLVSPLILKKVGTTKRRLQWLMLIYGVLMTVFIAVGWLAPLGPMLAVILFIEGFLVLSFQSLMLSLPVFITGIGAKYSATAAGLIVTIQLLGAVVFTSYVVAPIAGDNYHLLYLLLASAGVLFCVISRFLPLDDLVKKQ